jgi:hypothetical protein
LSRVTSRSSAAFRPEARRYGDPHRPAVRLPIRIAAKIDAADQEYFEREIEPLFALPHVEYIGEIADHQKAEFCRARMRCCFRSTGRSRSGW